MKKERMMIGLIVIAGMMFVAAMVWAPAQAAPEPLPPRPATPTATSVPEPVTIAKSTPGGAVIVLEVIFPEDWPARGLAWQDLWTVVEWQDPDGVWHSVDGWQGNLEKVSGHTGWVVWWLANDLLGEGPFRWVVLAGQGSPEMAISESFNLPGHAGAVERIELSLAR